MRSPFSLLSNTLLAFTLLINLATCAILSQDEFTAKFKSKGDAYYKDRLLFFTGTAARSAIPNFRYGYQAKLTSLCIKDRPDLIVLGDVLKEVGISTYPTLDDPEFDEFWGRASHSLATVASGTIYVLVPAVESEWGKFYKNVEKDLLINNPAVKNVLELEFDGPNKGKVSHVVKGDKEWDSIDLLTAVEYQNTLGPEANQALQQEITILTPNQETAKLAMMAKLGRNKKKPE